MFLDKARLKKVGSTLLALVGVTAVFLFTNFAGKSEFFYTAAYISAGIQQPQNGLSMLSDSLTKPSASTATTHAQTSIASTSTSTNTKTTRTSQTVSSSHPPKEAGDGGKIIETTLAIGKTYNNIAIQNKSKTAISLEDVTAQALDFKLSKKDGPKVLIVHTHTTENYMLYDAGYYNAADTQRIQDETKNVCAVGEAVATALRRAGVETVHDTTIHDYPKYQGAYTRSAQTVQKNLKQYPTIQVVLDLHRDCIMRNDTDKIKPTVEIDGKKAAQIMMVMGVSSTESSPHPNWKKNLNFAIALQRSVAASYSELARPISLTNTRYNQHLSTGYLLVEMGTDANTVDEAVYSGQLLGEKLAEIMLGTKDAI